MSSITPEPTDRARALGAELRAVHARLRRALQVARDSLDGPAADDGADAGTGTGTGADTARQTPLRADLLLFCHGFCAALTGHHRGEDGTLFPEVRRVRPDLATVLDRLEHDHHLIDLLVRDLEAAMTGGASPERLQSHLDGLAAITASHFAFEERRLLPVLDALGTVPADPVTLFGPLAEAGPRRPAPPGTT